MDAHLFRRFCEDLTPLLTGARVEKIQEPSPGFLALTFFSAGRKRQLCWRHGRKDPFCFVTAQRISVGHAPTAQVMRLRKYAAGRRIAACVARCFERRLWLLLSAGDRAALGPGELQRAPRLSWLLLDLREGVSVHFLESDHSPEEEQPLWPEPAQLAQALHDWRCWPVLTPALRRSLARMDEPEQWALLEDLRAGGGDVFCYGLATDSSDEQGEAQTLRAVSAWPLPPELRRTLLQPEEAAAGQSLRESSGADALALVERAGQSLVLSRLAEERAREEAQPLYRRGRKLARLLDKLREEEARLTAMAGGQADGLALQAELWRWPPDFRAAGIDVPEGPHGPARRIVLDPRHTVREGMARLFHTARRGQRGLEHVLARRAALEEDLAVLAPARALPGAAADAPSGAALHKGRSAAAALARTLPKNVQLFVSSDGYVLLRGRDAKGNMAARRLAAPHDIWLHAENGPGAHVIIRRAHAGQEVPWRTLDEAGSLAASKSWQKDAARARIQYAEVRHVKALRNAPAGTVRIDKSLPSREVPVDSALEESLLPT